MPSAVSQVAGGSSTVNVMARAAASNVVSSAIGGSKNNKNVGGSHRGAATSSSPLATGTEAATTSMTKQALQELIDAEWDAHKVLLKQSQEVRDNIQKSNSGKEAFQTSRSKLDDSISKIDEQIKKLNEERSAIENQVTERQKSGNKLRGKAESLQKSVGFKSPESLQAREQELQNKLVTETLALNEEKAIMAELDRIRKSRPVFDQMAAIQKNAADLVQSVPQASVARLDEIKTEMRNKRQQRVELVEKRQHLVEKRRADLGPVQTLIDERERLRKEMALHAQKAQELRQKLNQKIAEERAADAMKKAKRMEKERIERERTSLDKQRKLVQAQLEKVDEAAAVNETEVLLQQTIQYLSDILARRQPKAAASPVSVNKVSTIPEGYTMMPRKDPEEVMTFGKKSQKKQTAQSTAESPSSSAVASLAVDGPIQHTLQAVQNFSKLGVDTYPQTSAECTQAKEHLEKELNEEKLRSAEKREAALLKRQELMAKLDELNEQEQELIDIVRLRQQGAKAPQVLDDDKTSDDL